MKPLTCFTAAFALTELNYSVMHLVPRSSLSNLSAGTGSKAQGLLDARIYVVAGSNYDIGAVVIELPRDSIRRGRNIG